MTKLSWDDIEKITDELVAKIRTSGFTPDYAVGITMGGLIPMYFVAKKLKIENLLTVSARSYVKDAHKKLEVTYLPEADLAGKKVLLIDDISDTGDTLKELSLIMDNRYAVAELKTVTVAVNIAHSKFYPDFHILEAEEWVAFPWEKSEFPEFF